MSYRNKWIPEKALAILLEEKGRILDVGGGAAPYCRASHIVDIQRYEAERLASNSWGARRTEDGGQRSEVRGQRSEDRG